MHEHVYISCIYTHARAASAWSWCWSHVANNRTRPRDVLNVGLINGSRYCAIDKWEISNRIQNYGLNIVKCIWTSSYACRKRLFVGLFLSFFSFSLYFSRLPWHTPCFQYLNYMTSCRRTDYHLERTKTKDILTLHEPYYMYNVRWDFVLFACCTVHRQPE